MEKRTLYAALAVFGLLLVGYGMNLDGKVMAWMNRPQAAAKPKVPADGFTDKDNPILAELYEGGDIEGVKNNMTLYVKQNDHDGNGLDLADLEPWRKANFEEWRETVMNVDDNDDRRLSRRELTSAAQGVIGEMQANEMLGLYDKNRDGAVAFEEIDHPRRAPRAIEHMASYMVLDADGDGHVSLDETKAAVDSLFGRLDADHDGKITVEETKRARRQFDSMQADLRALERKETEQELAAREVGKTLGRETDAAQGG